MLVRRVSSELEASVSKDVEAPDAISFSAFRTHCRQLARDVAATGQVLHVSRGGRPFIEVRPAVSPQSTLTARAVTSTTSSSDEPAWIIIKPFAQCDSGITSVAENAVPFENEK